VQNLTRVDDTQAARHDECAAHESQGLISVPSLGTLVNQVSIYNVDNVAL